MGSQEHLLHWGQHLHGHLRSEPVQQLLAEETTGHNGQGGDPRFSQHRQPGLLLWQSLWSTVRGTSSLWRAATRSLPSPASTSLMPSRQYSEERNICVVHNWF